MSWRAGLLLTRETVLMSGLVALVLNLILPQEDTDDDDDVVEVLDVEAQSHAKDKGVHEHP